MVNIFVLVLVLAGLSNIITYNGGIEYILAKLEHTITKKQYAQYIILLLITCINMTIGINTISILVTGPLALKLSEKYNINPTYTACILDIGSCISQGLLPYAPQLLLAASMAHVSSISLLPYLYYQYLLTITLGITIAYNRKQQ
jgi:Na+/H+ antiporter NhaC